MKKKRIMIVDDNEDIIESIIAGIGYFNPSYIFSKAKNGEEALRMMKEEKPDLVILDVMMPVMDGWITSLNMKKDDGLSDVPILFLSAKSDNLSKNIGKLSGEDYIEKPFDLRDLNERVHQALMGRSED